jgi:hypothetical protein
MIVPDGCRDRLEGLQHVLFTTGYNKLHTEEVCYKTWFVPAAENLKEKPKELILECIRELHP